jgi:hypothetical protein
VTRARTNSASTCASTAASVLGADADLRFVFDENSHGRAAHVLAQPAAAPILLERMSQFGNCAPVLGWRPCP